MLLGLLDREQPVRSSAVPGIGFFLVRRGPWCREQKRRARRVIRPAVSACHLHRFPCAARSCPPPSGLTVRLMRIKLRLLVQVVPAGNDCPLPVSVLL